jgi:hypothetical protein
MRICIATGLRRETFNNRASFAAKRGTFYFSQSSLAFILPMARHGNVKWGWPGQRRRTD